METDTVINAQFLSVIELQGSLLWYPEEKLIQMLIPRIKEELKVFNPGISSMQEFLYQTICKQVNELL